MNASSIRHISCRYRRCLAVGMTGIMVSILGLMGCTQMPLQSGPSRSSSLAGDHAVDRLVEAYPDDLFTKQFQVIADFEDPRQATLFHREPDRATEAVAITTAKAQLRSGVGSLKISLADSSQRIVAADSAQATWSLHQDWAPYHLLLLNVWSPRAEDGFRLSIRSGGNNPLVYEHPRIALKMGWNRIRIDLGDVAEKIYLGDVRELQFWCDPLYRPIDLYLDDVILANNTREILANPSNMPGELSVKSQGRRVVVTSAERFELMFYRGQIRQWFDLAADPQRMHNLVGSASLGPIPVPMKEGRINGASNDRDANAWSLLGAMAESHQSIIDVSPLRVTIQGEWRFGPNSVEPSEKSPYWRWTYSVCRGGEVFVECNGSIPNAGIRQVGMLVGCEGGANFQRFISPSPLPTPANGSADHPATDSENNSAHYVLFSQSQPANADLLVVPAQPITAQPIDNGKERGREQGRMEALFPVPVESDQFAFAAMLRVWPNDVDSPSQAGPLALAYSQPMPITVDTGSLVRTDPGDLNGDGFSEQRGYYVLQLDGRVASVRLDGREHLRVSPTFKVVDVGGYDVWVYVDGRLIRNTQRDAHNDLLFEIPGMISREILIDIHARKPDTTAPAN
ncbi:MAG: hypothetical protein FWC56_04255 [Phycisphaerae bacterium]|nr:hypothetical protein [Phycisphaerae bacterium]